MNRIVLHFTESAAICAVNCFVLIMSPSDSALCIYWGGYIRISEQNGMEKDRAAKIYLIIYVV